MKRVYVSHPIAGQADKGAAMAQMLRGVVGAHGGIAVLPLDIEPEPHDGECPPGYNENSGEHSSACHMRADLLALLGCDAIVMAPGCWQSTGCKMEMNVAEICGIPIYFWDEISNRLIGTPGRIDVPLNVFDMPKDPGVKGCEATTYKDEGGDAVVSCDMTDGHEKIIRAVGGKNYVYDHHSEKYGVSWKDGS